MRRTLGICFALVVSLSGLNAGTVTLLIPVVSQTFPLADFNKALDQIATRHTRGKVVLQVAAEPRS
jgi:NADPH:quinone reductase-like Zn-dependent oxidoreductase